METAKRTANSKPIIHFKEGYRSTEAQKKSFRVVLPRSTDLWLWQGDVN